MTRGEDRFGGTGYYWTEKRAEPLLLMCHAFIRNRITDQRLGAINGLMLLLGVESP